ncbi:MAG TPA: MJ1255/VC2487 family glycosyltransferase [Polyangiaceae bacterium]|nr:MJ1255/VC2487 family glycosyltransferase [Polyangiaceae bacterium]
MRILYGVVGEGMGHATRSKVVIDHLIKKKHKVKIVVSGRAYAFLKRHFPDVVEIRGLTIRYSAGAMDRDLSVVQNVLLSPSMLFQNAAAYIDDVRHFQPKIVLSDFDSYAWFFARRFGLPILSIDNQQIIHKCKHADEITKGVRADYSATRAFVKAKLPGCEHYVITSFFKPTIRAKFQERVTIVPPILREEILKAHPTRGEHVLVYQTSTSDRALLAQLNRLHGRKFVVYGLGRDAVEGNCTLHSFSEQRFVRDLASARAVVTNGGLSLIHEAIYLGKPILSVPVRHQFEQEMNARYLEQYGYGLAAPRFDADVLDAFLRQERRYVEALGQHRQKGNEVLYRTVDHLVKSQADRSTTTST